MKLLVGFIALAKAQEVAVENEVAGPGALSNLLQVADDAQVVEVGDYGEYGDYGDYGEYDGDYDGRARPGANWNKGQGSSSWKPSGNKRPQNSPQKQQSQQPQRPPPQKQQQQQRPQQQRPNQQRPNQRPQNQRPQRPAVQAPRPPNRPQQAQRPQQQRPQQGRPTQRPPFRPNNPQKQQFKPNNPQKQQNRPNNQQISNWQQNGNKNQNNNYGSSSSYNSGSSNNYNSGSSSYNSGSNNNYNSGSNSYNGGSSSYQQPVVQDINECYKGTDNCHYNAQCINTYGSFRCVCKQGYTGDGVNCQQPDVDECATGRHNCSAYATCKNTYGAYTCNCNSGWSGNGYTCTEDNPDECANGTHNCDVNAECLDKNWGFRCRCNSGYKGDGVTCTPNSYGTTTTTDPCASCSPYANCSGGDAYSVATCACKSGYTGTGVGSMGCYDVDECFTGTHNCAASQTCINMIGAFVCSGSTGYGSSSSSGTYNSGSSGSYSGSSSSSSGTYSSGSSSSTYTSSSSSSGTYSSGSTSSSGYSGSSSGTTSTTDVYGNTPVTASCSDGNTYCSAGATCMDTAAGVQCICSRGFKGTGRLSQEEREQRLRPTNSGSFTVDKDKVNNIKNQQKESFKPSSDPTKNSATYSSGSSSTYTSSSSSSTSTSTSSSSTYSGTTSTSDPYAPVDATSGTSDGCSDIDECAGCMAGGSYSSSSCPCSDPTPVCMNTAGGYTCGTGTAFGDPHLRVTTPGEDAVCFDVNAENASILDLFGDDESALQVNAQFKNVHGDKKQFIKAIGFTSPKGVQLSVSPFFVEIYNDGQLYNRFNITERIDEIIFDTHVRMTPANPEIHHNKHIVAVNCRDGEEYKFGVKPNGGSLSVDLEKWAGMTDPSGLIGQFLGHKSYTVDEDGNIHTDESTIPASERTWHQGNQCHEIKEEHVPLLLGRNVTDYQTSNLFGQLFKRGPEATLIENDVGPK